MAQIIKLILTLLIGLVAIAGDNLVIKYDGNSVAKAFSDNITHGVIGGLTWMVFDYSKPQKWEYAAGTAVCLVLSSFIDLDHFLQARSFRLQDMKNFPSRPIMHCTTLMVLISVILNAMSYLIMSRYVNLLSWSLFGATMSHHTRDATRRGFWCYPFGSTPPIPYFSYILLLIALPYFMEALRNFLDADFMKKILVSKLDVKYSIL